MRSNSKTLGDYAELRVASVLAKRGYIVSRPLSDNAAYDLIVDKDSSLKRVQVKSRCTRNGKLLIELRTTSSGYVNQYSRNDFDILAVHDMDSDRVAFLDWHQIGTRKSIVLRMDPTKNGQSEGVIFFSDYEV